MSIPKGVTVITLVYAMHRDAKIFPQPDKFMPERFLSDEKQHPFAYGAFSAGPRNCIG